MRVEYATLADAFGVPPFDTHRTEVRSVGMRPNGLWYDGNCGEHIGAGPQTLTLA